MITAIVLVQTDPASIPEVAGAIADLPRVLEVYSVTGDVDLIVRVRVASHEELAGVIAEQLSKVPGVRETRTYIAFQTYSRHDLEEGFDLGLS